MTDAATALKQKIEDRSATISVVGLGYVGLPLGVEFARAGFTTIGIDLDPSKIASLRSGKNYIQDIPDETVASVVASGKFIAENTYDSIGSADVIYLCVPTPFTDFKEPDISYIRAASESVAKHLRSGQLIILKSTTYPNTTEGVVQPILEATGMKCGTDFYLAFSPERIDPGNTKFNTANTPIVVGGVTAECTELASLVSRQVISEVIPVSSPKVAEMEKLLENIFRSVNIALVNELAKLCDRMGGINMWEVVEAAATKPFGFMPFYPGPGIGGHCILIDPYYLSWFARSFDFETNFITLAAETNESMPFYVRDMVIHEVAHLPKSIEAVQILILGVAFKKNVDDTRHSPALKIIELLYDDGVKDIVYNDPFVANVTVAGKRLSSISLDAKTIQSADIVVITTDHTSYDMEMIVKNAALVIDTRNAAKNVTDPALRKKIVLLGSGLEKRSAS